MVRKAKYNRRYPSKKTVKKIVKYELAKNMETKFVTVVDSGQRIEPPGTNNTEYVLNDAFQGTGQQERIGSQMKNTGLYMRGNITNVGNNNVVRMILYIPKAPASSMKNDTYSVNTIVDTDKYTVLLDKLYTVNTQYPIKNFIIKKKLRMTTQYLNNSNNVTKNILKLYFVSNGVASNFPELNLQTKTYFKDG